MNFSFSGYGTALSFKDLDKKDDIPLIERFVRTTLTTSLDSALAEQKMEYSLNEKMWFFGPFATSPQNFAFPPGELKTLFSLVHYVKQLVDQPTECCGLHHFSNDKVLGKKGMSYEENMVQSVFGLVFGCLREKKLSKLTDSLEEKRKDLYKKASILFEQFETSDHVFPNRKFSLDLVNVTFIDQKWKGQVGCVFCKENEPNSDVKLSLKPPACWLLANLTKHIINNHTNQNVNTNKAMNGRVKTIKLKVEPIEGIELIQNQNVTNSSNGVLASSVIEDNLYDQLYTQCIKMTNRTVANVDPILTKHFDFGSALLKEKPGVQYCEVAGNGDCFFLSIAHQLFNVKVGSKEHEDEALALRGAVVSHIKRPENFPNFIHELKNRVDYDKHANNDEINEICLNFLEKDLSTAGTWAGMESIKAICEIKNVNLLVINDDGKSYLPSHFNSEAEQCLLLLFGSQDGKDCNSNVDRTHYNSVVEMNKNTIMEIIKQINEAEDKHQKFKEAANRSAIVID